MKVIKSWELDRKNIIIGAFSILMGIIGVLTKMFLKPSLVDDAIRGLETSFFSLGNLAIFILVSLFCFGGLQLLFIKLGKANVYENVQLKEADKYVFVRSFLMVMVCWGIWFWVYFPGTGMNDTINCIMSFHNDNQTLIYQLIIYYGINGLTKLTSNMTISYALMTFAQMVLMSLIVAWIAKWLCNKGMRRIFVNLFIIYYALMPVVADYSITLVKDTLFGFCMMAVIPHLYDLINKYGEPMKDKKFYFTFLFTLLGICVLRSNGKFIVLILLLLLLIARIKNKRHILTMLGIVIAINSCISVGEDKIIVGEDANFRESVSVPLAQIGAVLVTDGYISDEDKDVLSNLLPLDTWEEAYRLSFVDLIKFNQNFDNNWLNQNKGKFISTWFSVLKSNFEVYLKSFLCHTYGFWNISPFSPTDYTQSYFTEINNNTGEDSWWGEFCTANNLSNREFSATSITGCIDNLLRYSVKINLCLKPGILFWIIICFMLMLTIYKKYQMCFIFMSAILNWATMMIAAPGSYIYRYSFYLVLSLPVLLVLTQREIKKKE